MSKRSWKGLLLLAGFLFAGMFVPLMPGSGSGTRAPLVVLILKRLVGVSVVHLESPADVQFVTDGEKRAAQQGTTRVRFEYGENDFLLLCPESRRWTSVGGFFSKNHNCSFEVSLQCHGKRDPELECRFDRRVRWGVSWLLSCDANEVFSVETKPCMGGPSGEENRAEEPQAADPKQVSR
jgi:hypothetical protein